MNLTQLLKELEFKTSRSSGAGGQHVNKVSSKVEVSFNIKTSLALHQAEKDRLLDKLQTKLSQNSILNLSCSETRSQHKNKAIVIQRLINILKENLKVAKKRKATKPTKASKLKRTDNKRKHSLKKTLRKKPKID